MGKIFCAAAPSHLAETVAAVAVEPAPGRVLAVEPPPFDLYAVHAGVEGQDEKPRDATSDEVRAYLAWLAKRDGHGIPAGACYCESGLYSADGTLIVAMPGYGKPEPVICELLDDAGEVARRIVLPIVQAGRGRGGVPMTAAQAKDWTGIVPAKKPRATKAKKPVAVAVETPPPAPAPVPGAVEPVQPAAAAPASVAPSPDVDALAARLAALETMVARLTRPATAGKRVRSEAERAAIVRAWRYRAQMRERADLDRRALMIANGDNRALHEALQRAETDRGVALDRADYLAGQRDRLFAENNQLMERRRSTARRLSTARAAARTARRECRGMETAWRIADAEVQRLAPVAAALAAIAAAAPPPVIPTGPRLVAVS